MYARWYALFSLPGSSLTCIPCSLCVSPCHHDVGSVFWTFIPQTLSRTATPSSLLPATQTALYSQCHIIPPTPSHRCVRGLSRTSPRLPVLTWFSTPVLLKTQRGDTIAANIITCKTVLPLPAAVAFPLPIVLTLPYPARPYSSFTIIDSAAFATRTQQCHSGPAPAGPTAIYFSYATTFYWVRTDSLLRSAAPSPACRGFWDL